MPTAADLVTAVNSALNLACDMAGVPHPDDQLAAANAQVQTLTAANAQLTADLKGANDLLALKNTQITLLQADIQAIKDADATEDAAVAKAENDAK